MTTPEPMTHCPSEETLAAFIDGRLDPQARRKVIEHMSNCGDCRSVLDTAAEFQTAEGGAAPAGGTVSRFTPRFYFSSAAFLTAAAVMIVVFGPAIRERMFPPTTGIAALVEASEGLEQRTLEGRLSGDFAYKPLKPVVRSANSSEDVVSLRLRAAAGEAERAAKAAPSPEAFHALGVAYLLLDRPHDAISALEKALEAESGQSDLNVAIRGTHSSALMNDLASAYLAVSRTEPNRIPEAFAAVERVLELDSDSQPALYNHALILETLGLRDEAAQAWEAYLRVDSTSGWAIEARAHRDRLRARTERDWGRRLSGLAGDHLMRMPEVSTGPQTARVHAEDVVLPRWAAAYLSGTRDDDTLDLAESIGRVLSEVVGDYTVADQVQRIRTSNDARRRSIARALVRFGEARFHFREAPTDGALKQEFIAARDALSAVDSPLAFRAAIYGATNDVYRGAPDAALRDVQSAIHLLGARSGRYPSLVGHLHWVLGLARFSLLQPDEALDAYSTAAAAFERAGETGNQAGVESNVAEVLRSIGQSELAWPHTLHAVQLIGIGSTPQRRHVVASAATRVAILQEQSGLARVLNERVLRGAAEAKNPVYACDGLLARQEIERRSLRPDAAIRSLEIAEARLKEIPKEDERSRLRAHLDLAWAESLVERDPDRSLTYASRAIGRLADLKLEWLLPRARRIRSDAFVNENDIASAISELRLGVAEYRRSQLKADLDRVAFMESGRALFDRLVALTVERNALDAWQASEEMRDSGIAGQMEWSAPLRTPVALPPDIATVTYHILDRELLVWIGTGSRRVLVRVPVTRSHLERLVHETVARVRAAPDAAALKTGTAELHRVLAAPAIPHIGPAVRTVLLEPDSILSEVPFAALSTRGEPFLMERWALVVIPGQTGLSRASVGTSCDLSRGSLAVFSDPASAFSPAPLPGSRDEAALLGSIWPRHQLYVGESATIAAFEKAAESSDVVHYGGHAVAWEADPGKSALLLAPGESSTTGRLEGRVIAELRLRSRLIVLAGCRTATGTVTSQGSMSLARAFAVSGVRSVVASLWDAEDRHSPAFWKRFYGFLRAGRDPEEALREAQLETIRDRSIPPAVWAGMQLFGIAPKS